jgi:hypothetical protein
MVDHLSSLTRTAPGKANIIHQNKTHPKVIYQNIRGLRNNNRELLTSSLPHTPQIKCTTEHQLSEQEIKPSCEKCKCKKLNHLHTSIKPIKNDYRNNQLMIYHQNIRGFKGKINELLLTLPSTAPHLICFTEHH